MNNIALSKIKECLSLASEFVKDENTYHEGGVFGGISSSSMGHNQVIIRKKSNDIRAEAEQKASRLEKQEKCANLIKECLEYLKAVDSFENNGFETNPITKCECQNK